MKIKQQKQIKEFLVDEFGNEEGNKLYEKQDKILASLIEISKDHANNRSACEYTG